MNILFRLSELLGFGNATNLRSYTRPSYSKSQEIPPF